MKFQLNKHKIQFHKVDSFDAGGWDLTFCETMYKVFYTFTQSFVYNLKNGKRTYFPFTDFNPFIISNKGDSIFLFKIGSHLTKKEERILFRYNLENSTLEDMYDLSQHFIGIENFYFIKIDYINDTDLAILMENYDSNTFGIIVLNTDTKKSLFVEIDKDMTIDTYYRDAFFVFEGDLYIPYIVPEDQRGLFKFLHRRNDVLKEQGILKYKNGKLEKIKSLSIEYIYNFFTDNSGEYLAYIKLQNKKYQVDLYYHNECILKQEYILKKKENISFKFSYSKNNDVLFVAQLKSKYEIYNLIDKTVLNINMTEEQMKKSFMLSNNIILIDDETSYDIYSDKSIRNLYEFEV